MNSGCFNLACNLVNYSLTGLLLQGSKNQVIKLVIIIIIIIIIFIEGAQLAKAVFSGALIKLVSQ